MGGRRIVCTGEENPEALETGELIAFALPAMKKGLVWRIAKNANPQVLVQVSEAIVGPKRLSKVAAFVFACGKRRVRPWE